VASVDVVAGVSNTCGCGMVGVLINGALQLFQELIDVQKIALGPEVGKRQ
jgi:hypothetical protein